MRAAHPHLRDIEVAAISNVVSFFFHGIHPFLEDLEMCIRDRLHVLRNLRPCQDIIGKAKLHRLVRVHPGFRIHEVGQLGTGQPGLDLIGVDDGLSLIHI